MQLLGPLHGIRMLVSAALVKLFYRPPDNWEMLRADDAVAIWKTLSPLLEFHGLFVRWVWGRANIAPPPPVPPLDYLGRDPFTQIRPSHTIPVIRTINLRGGSILIYPLWGFVWYKPVRECIARRIEIARDLLEGLAFMHLNGVAHGDIHSGNILCGHENARSKPELQQDVQLHQAFIDFESAVIFPLGSADHCVKVEEVYTKPPSAIRAPEQEKETQWDGFAADVYNLGRCFQQDLVTKDIEAIQEWVEVVDDMTRCEPSQRISAEQAFRLMDELLKGLLQ